MGVEKKSMKGGWQKSIVAAGQGSQWGRMSSYPSWPHTVGDLLGPLDQGRWELSGVLQDSVEVL